MAAGLGLSGFGKGSHTVTVSEPTTIETQVQQTDLDYSVSGVATDEEIDEARDEERIAIMSDLDLGDQTYIQDGQKFFTNSTLDPTRSTSKTMGDEFTKENKEEGNYVLTGISIYVPSTGEIINFEEAFHGEYDKFTENDMDNVNTFVQTTLEQRGLSLEDVNVRLHYGLYQDISVLGWIDITSLYENYDMTDEEISQMISEQLTKEGTVQNFSGDSITIDGVTINVKDADGNLLAPGTEVIGSDGQTYVINDLQAIDKTTTTTETKMVEHTKVVDDGITYSVSNISLLPVILPGLGLLALSLKAKKDKKKDQEEATFETFTDETKYTEFKQAVRDYKKQSKSEEVKKHQKLSEKLDSLIYTMTDQVQELSPEEIEQLQSFCWDKTSTMDLDADEIYIDHGQVYIVKNGIVKATSINLTNASEIGRDESIVVEGQIPDEYENGISTGGLKR